MKTISLSTFAAVVCAAGSLLTGFSAGHATAAPLESFRDEVLESLYDFETSFLPNWMGTLAPLIGNDTLLDISVPGTHDTLTSDLSTRFADNWGDEFPSWVNWLLGTFGDIPLVGSFTRLQSKTQGALITQQLDAGVRFLDFRAIRRWVWSWL